MAQAPIWDDLRSFDGRPWRGRVHLVTAGYPCQPFTLSGNRKGKDDPRHLWPEVARIVGEIQPQRVFFENVPGHLSLGLQDVACDLQAMGYRVAARVVSAAEVGASHTRERVFILGHADVQIERQPGMHSGQPIGDSVQDGSEPNGHSDRIEEPSPVLDAALGRAGGRGLEGYNIPFFAPKSDDIAEWRKALRKRPDLKPCLHRLDDGVACGVDRSAAAGNGVVSLAAARAWVALNAELRGC